ncbi:MAG: peroxiredoxin [Chloroflexi bacterium]|nr:peroxiredoxin [Chloroflexota bacterium]
MAVEVGQVAPDFTLFDMERKPRKLSEFREKNVVLAFFPGAFTGVCTHEMCTFRDNAAKLNSLNAQVVGISVDSPFSLKGWATQNNLEFPLLSDFNRKVVTQYGVTWTDLGGLEGYVSANRAVFLLDKGGIVRYKWVAPQPGNEPDYEEVNQALAKLSR